jgi:septal ring factor EnvC (AmiA/AmiB activator)
LIGAAMASGGPAWSQSVPTGTTEIRKAIEAKKSELDSTQQRAKALELDVDSLAAEREKINARLLETAALIQKSEGQLTESEGRLEELQVQEKLVRGSLNERYAKISTLLSALQRMGRNPPPVMITRREDALKMVRSAMLLSSAFPGMRTQALALREKLVDLVAVMDKIRAERDRLEAETQRLTEMRHRLAGLMETKKQSLSERRAELDKVRVAAAEISRSVEDLNGLFQRLDEVAKRTEAEAYERELKSQMAARQAEPPVASAPSPSPGTPLAAAEPAPAPGAATSAAQDTPSRVSPPAAETPGTAAAASGTQMAALPQAVAPAIPSPKVVELAPASNSLVPGSPGRIKPSIEFHLAKAKLPLPAQGRRVLSFGDKTQYGGLSKGIVLETRRSAQIVSPCDGWIVYAGEFRSYGQLLIINAGGGYHVLLAGLSQIDVQPGQFVLAAEPVGTMSAAVKAAQPGAEAGAPVLYVEFRKDGDPVNPDPWWVEAQQKAQNEQKVQG